MNPAFTEELIRLARGLDHPALAVEVGVLAGCLALAWILCWMLGRRLPASSVWFGRITVDGLLFPLVALALTYAAEVILARWQSVALLRIAVPMLVALAGIRFLARVLTLVFPASQLARMVEHVFSWMAWIAAALWIAGLLPGVIADLDALRFGFGKSSISMLDLLRGVIAVGVVLIATLWISAVLERRVLSTQVNDLSLRKVAANVVRAALLVTGMMVALSSIGVDLTAFSVLGGALGVGIGFGLQKLAANYVSGFVILFERSLRIGDTVRVGSFEGQVMDIKTRYTLIRALNGRESIVPNEKLIVEPIENLSLADPLVLLTTSVTVGYDSDVEVVQRVLCEAARSAPRVLPQPAPAARLANLGADGLEFQLHYWIGDPANGQGNVKSDVNLAVLSGLRAAAIEIPYPQRVVRLVGDRPTDVERPAA